MLKIGKKSTKAKAGAGRPASAAPHPQGIVAKGNSLYRLAGQALLIMLVPLLLGFAYLITLREPSVQDNQIERISFAFATQQATNIQHMQQRLQQRIRGAAKSSLAKATAAGENQISEAQVEQAMLAYFPDLISIKVLPIGDMGTAGFASGSNGLRNHREVDLVRRTSEGEITTPESFQYEGRWLTSMAALVELSEDSAQRGVVIATMDNDALAKQLTFLNASAGKFTLQQQFSKGKAEVIASSGKGAQDQYAQRSPVPGTFWQVIFTPSLELLQSVRIDTTPLLGTLALCVLAAMGGLALIVLRFPKTISSEIDKIISAADRKSSLEIEIPELVVIAKQLRRATLRALSGRRAATAQPAAGAASTAAPAASATAVATSSDLTNPMFQSGSILDSEEEEEVLELDIDEMDDAPMPLVAAEEGFPDHIFRAYDIRGLADAELNDDLVARIGGAVGTLASEQGEQTLIVGCDGRLSSPRIKSTLIKALMESGRDVIDIGMVCTPVLYFATRHLDCASGVMITGSHNPGEYNGMKIVLNQHTIAAGGIQDIRNRVVSGSFSRGNGRMIREDIVPSYIEEIIADIAIAVPLKIVIDAGNGATSEIAPHLFEELGCEVVPLYCEIDGHFPNHPPDTSDERNLVDLAAMVQRVEADFGVAFDGDGDRLAVVTSSGRIIRSDILLMIYAQDIVARNPGADVVFDVKCSRNLTQLITQNGGRPVLWKTGHAFMKEKMAETGALLGGEFSGHMFFGERWFGFDDGMYAAGRLAEILSTNGDTLDCAIDQFPVTVNTAEILLPITESDKFSFMSTLTREADFPAGKINTLDGIRVDFAQGWGLLRASNTSAALTARFEADTEQDLEVIKQEFRDQIAIVDPTLAVPF